jgi:hypothetical protein
VEERKREEKKQVRYQTRSKGQTIRRKNNNNDSSHGREARTGIGGKNFAFLKPLLRFASSLISWFVVSSSFWFCSRVRIIPLLVRILLAWYTSPSHYSFVRPSLPHPPFLLSCPPSCHKKKNDKKKKTIRTYQ